MSAPLAMAEQEFTLDLPLQPLPVPATLWVEDGLLVWSPESRLDRELPDSAGDPTPLDHIHFTDTLLGIGHTVKPSVAMLFEFAHLGEFLGGDAEQRPDGLFGPRVLQFASKWGVLALCDRNLPVGHPDGEYNFGLRPPQRSDRQANERTLAGQSSEVLVNALRDYLLAEHPSTLRPGGAGVVPEGARGTNSSLTGDHVRGHDRYTPPSPPPPRKPYEREPETSEQTLAEHPLILEIRSIDSYIDQRLAPTFGEGLAEQVRAVLMRAAMRNASSASRAALLAAIAAELADVLPVLPAVGDNHRCHLVHNRVGSPELYDEPLSAWAYYARSAYHLIEVIWQINVVEKLGVAKTRAERDDLEKERERLMKLWGALDPAYLPASSRPLPPLIAQGADVYDEIRTATARSHPDAHREELLPFANQWVELGNIRTKLDSLQVNPSGREVRTSVMAIETGIVGCLGLQMRALILGIERLARCAECMRFFVPARRAGPKRRTRCDSCKAEQRPERRHERRYREKQAARTPPIAALLGLEPGPTPEAHAERKREELLSDRLWSEIAPVIPSPPRPGPPGIGPREKLTGIVLIIRGRSLLGHELAWADIPPQLGCGTGATCHSQLKAWHRDATWPQIRRVLERHLGHIPDLQWEKAELRGRHPRKED